LQFLARADFANYLDKLLAAAGVDEFAEFGEQFKVDVRILLHHEHEITGIPVFLGVSPHDAHHRAELQGERHFQRGHLVGQTLRLHDGRMPQTLAVQWLN